MMKIRRRRAKRKHHHQSSVSIASATLPGLMRISKEEFENDQCEIYQVDDGNNPEMEMSKKKGQ